MLGNLWQRLKAFVVPVKFAEPPVEQNIANLPILERCRVVYSQLELSPYFKYQQTDGHGKMINVAHQNIDACLSDISQHIHALEQSKFVPQGRGEYERIGKPINRFFITKEGYYLSSVYQKLVDLKTVMLDLCNVVDKTKDTDYYSYNLRMLNSLLFVMLDLGALLTELGEDIKTRS
jgi:hypothetical protein